MEFVLQLPGNRSISGALRAGAIGYLTAPAFNEVGNMNLGAGSISNIAAHAAVGCVSSVASGGKCQSGALAAGFSESISPYVGGGVEMQVVQEAIIGGTASVLGGGKFANGAVTGAFGYLFNCLMHECLAQGRDAEKTFVNYLNSSGQTEMAGLQFKKWSDGAGSYFMGRPDIFSPGLNMVWDVKPDSLYGWGTGAEQIGRYTGASGYEPGAAGPLFGSQSSIVLQGAMNRYAYSFGGAKGPGLVIYRALDANPMERLVQQLFIVHSATRRDDPARAVTPLPAPFPIPIP